ncbi:unnamed protein product [Urochloa decumbens]|uniref:F-box domain-containing protein n=1 Tax=Urochloa decumbens TaxID=240449 RepID=A0ABC9BRZ1_9POAL
MARRRRSRRRGALPATFPLDGEDILREILVRLPTEPSSLPRASLVCKQWLRIVSDPAFLRRYRAHHEEPLLLGVFVDNWGYPLFRSIHTYPNAIPQERFLLPIDEWTGGGWVLLGCRHGRVLVFNQSRNEAIVWDPATGDRRYVAAPPEFDEKDKYVINGAVLCANTDEDHVHGDCHSSPFQVVLIGIHSNYRPVFASFYSSEAGVWGDIISIEIDCPPMYSMDMPSNLIGNSLYWLFDGEVEGILKFDLTTQSLAVIEMPSQFEYYSSRRSFQILPAEDDGIRLASLSCQIMEIWERKISSDGDVDWVMQKEIELGVILGLGHMGGMENLIKAYDEELQFILLRTIEGVFMIHLESMQFKNLGKDGFDGIIHTYSAFCTAVGDLAIGERRGDVILARNDSVSADASMGAGAERDRSAAASFGTLPEEGMLDDENMENVSNHNQRTGAGFKSSYSKRTKKGGGVTWLKKGKHNNATAFIGVRPKIRKFMRISLNTEQRKNMARNCRGKTKANLRNKVRLYDKEATSEIVKAWAKWFRRNGIPGTKANCPYFRRAIELTQQLGARALVPTGAIIDGGKLDASDEEG